LFRYGKGIIDLNAKVMQGTCDPGHAARSKNLVIPVP
jgi:hypothetical protein